MATLTSIAQTDFETVLMVGVKLGVGVLLGGIIGYERELHGRPAGIRTHMLIVLGVILFAEASRFFDPNEPARIAAQIVTGVGFLGAGTILRIGAEVKGLTSAASIWAVAGIGLCVSAGGALFWIAIVSAILTLFTLAMVDNIERRLAPHAHPRNLQVQLIHQEASSAVLAALDQCGGRVKGYHVVAREPAFTISVDVIGEHEALLAAVAQAPGIVSAHWTD